MVSIFYTEFVKSRWIPPALHGRAGKGHEEFIRAAATVIHEFPAAKFILVGYAWPGGGEKVLARMQALAAELGLGQSVIFTGRRKDVPQIYRDLDVCVQPSLNENLGGTIKSLLMECPTVATEFGGLPDSVVDGVTGVLVSPGDPNDLARGILEMLRCPARARALAKAGRERMLTRFTLSKTAADLDKVYQRLAELRGGYRSLAFAWRLVAAGVFCFGFSLRLQLFDLKFLPLWDQGWRPWRPSTWTGYWISTLLFSGYALVGQVAPGLGLHNRVATSRAMMSMRLRNKLLALRAMPKMLLYRSYAFVGRNVSFGLRARLASLRARTMIRLRNGGLALRSMPKSGSIAATLLLAET